jgi:S1-C subfamily serine protease
MNTALGATVTVLTGGGHGSGFVVSRDGLILTNHHVVGDARQVRVRFASGVQVDGTVLRRDARRDVALVRVPVTHDAPLPIRAAHARVGEEVYAIGTPLDEANAATVTRGIVSALRDDGPSGQLIQSDATIHGGNSGGPLLDRFGNVIGIAVAGQTDANTGQVAAGLNFFIPVGEALERLNLIPVR